MIARQRAFTLIEVLVAMTLVALLGVLGYRGLESTRRTADHLGRNARQWQEVALASDRFGRDVRQAIDRPGRRGNGEPSPAWWGRRALDEAADAAQLTFTRLGGANGDSQRLAYRWRALPGEPAGQLELLLWTSPESTQPPRQYVLLHNVRRMELAYLDAEQQWQPEWNSLVPPRSGRPRAVRLRLELAAGGWIERRFDLPGAP
ncbi:MAG: gspJ [Proteobacteria bacterium]|nr:gspJ [Pseudomonadota bacterium]